MLSIDLLIGKVREFLWLPLNISNDNTKASTICDSLDNDKSHWLILKCSKCHNKSIPMFINGIVSPVNKYCKNCGSKEFYFEQKESIEKLDTIYALYSKDVKEGMVRQRGTMPKKVCATSYLPQSI
ncbi:MAG: hypothetical protein AB7V50_03200 [Vampirovibrionia bacterium]